MDCLELLRSSIDNTTSLNEMVNVFEEMCKIPIKNDMILFETGTFSFTGQPRFYFSIVRQFPNDDDEYYQIHLDILFHPDSKNQNFSRQIWNIDLQGNIFDHIRTSNEFEYAKSVSYEKIDIYMDET